MLAGGSAFALVSGVLALLVLPEFAAAVGALLVLFAEVFAVSVDSVLVLFFFLLVGSVEALVPPAAVCSASAVLAFDLLFREDVPDAPAALVVLSVPPLLASVVESVSVFFLVLDFFEVVEVSPDAAVGAAVLSALSVAAFFFLVEVLFALLLLVPLLVWSVDDAAAVVSVAVFFFLLDLLLVLVPLLVWSVDCAAAVLSVAGFFFFFDLLVVLEVLESLCVWSLAWPVCPSATPVPPSVSSAAASQAKYVFFLIFSPCGIVDPTAGFLRIAPAQLRSRLVTGPLLAHTKRANHCST